MNKNILILVLLLISGAAFSQGGFPIKAVLDGTEKVRLYDNTGGNQAVLLSSLEGDGETTTQSNAGADIPAVLVDPTAIAAPIAGDAVLQVYDNGQVLSTFDGTVWTNTVTETQHVDGNILWVSVDGDNLTATKGDQHRPWADPWTAVAAATAGDVVFLLPGTWLASANPTATDNLYAADITVHSMEGVTIINDDGNTKSSDIIDLPQTGYTNYAFTGSADIIDFRFRINGTSADIHIQCDELIHNADNSGIGQFIGVSQTPEDVKVHIDIRRIEAIWTGFLTMRVNSNNSTWMVDVEEFLGTPTTTVANQTFKGFLVDGSTNSNYTFHIKDFENQVYIAGYDLNSQNNQSVSGVSYYRGIFNNCQLTFICDNYTQRSLDGYVGTTFQSDTRNEPSGASMVEIGNYVWNSTLTDCRLTVRVGNAFNYANFVNIAENTASTGNIYDIDIRNAYNPFGQSIFLARSGIGSMLKIKGDFYNEADEVVSQHANYQLGDDTIFSGLYQTTAAGANVFRMEDDGVTFFNARLVNDGTVAPYSATSAVNIVVQNAFSNSLIIDANVTEIVMPITRDPNVK